MRRRGSVLLEISMASGLVAVATVAIAQLLAVTAQQERAIEQRRLAGQEAANAVEQLLARPWADVTPDHVKEMALSENASQRLRSGRLTCEIEESPESPRGKKMTVIVTWQNRVGQEEHVQFSAWRFQSEPMP